jgi:hypothetical protein
MYLHAVGLNTIASATASVLWAGQLEVAGRGRPISENGAAPPRIKSSFNRRDAAFSELIAIVTVGAIDQEPTHTAVAHLGEGDFLRAGLSGLGPVIPPKWSRVKPLLAGQPRGKSGDTLVTLTPATQAENCKNA